MFSRRSRKLRPTPEWGRQKLLALIVGAAVTTVLIIVGLVLAVVYAVGTARHTTDQHGATADPAGQGSGDGGSKPGHAAIDPRDALADKPMATVDEHAAHPGPVSTRDPGTPITLPAATGSGQAQVPTGFAHTPQGAMAQLAAIDQTALQSGTMQGARTVIAAWAMRGGPTPTSWSGGQAMAQFLDAAGLSGGGANQLALVVTPMMGQVKGSVGSDFVVPCVDFEIDVSLQQTSRGAVADCQRMAWNGTRWMVGPGEEPANPPSVWPDTDTSIAVGYRDLRPGSRR